MAQKISYAQNSEDIILARVFSDIENGHYIDVGASHPKYDSVTKFFYDLGWTGINIEPLEAEFNLLRSDRPRDKNLNICVGSKKDLIKFAKVENRSGWSSSDPKQIQILKDNPELITTIIEVEQETLTSVISSSKFDTIHFLKIDVEGAEFSVLSGVDFLRIRPWVIVVESTEPGSTNQAYSEWEQILISNGYIYVYSDGLNRFYLSKDHPERISKFDYPPNVFDEFISLSTFEAQQAFINSEKANTELNNKVFELEKKLSSNKLIIQVNEEKIRKLENDLEVAEATIESQEWEMQNKHQELILAILERDAILNSTTWRLAKPLRNLGKIIKRINKLFKQVSHRAAGRY